VTQAWAFAGYALVSQGDLNLQSATVQSLREAATGDLLIAALSYGASGTLTLPTGWAHVTGSPATATVRTAVAWKIAGSSEPTSYTFSLSGDNLFTLLVARYTGILLSPAPVSGVATATSSTVTAPSVTTLATDSLVVRVALSDNATSLSFASGTARALVGRSGDLIRLADQNIASVGASGTNVATANTSNHLHAYSVAFKQGVAPTTHIVSGSGSFSIGGCAGLSVSYTGLPGSLGTGKGNPVRYFELGNIAWGTANGAARNYYLEHNPELIPIPFAGANLVYYSLIPGVTATFSELLTL